MANKNNNFTSTKTRGVLAGTPAMLSLAAALALVLLLAGCEDPVSGSPHELTVDEQDFGEGAAAPVDLTVKNNREWVSARTAIIDAGSGTASARKNYIITLTGGVFSTPDLYDSSDQSEVNTFGDTAYITVSIRGGEEDGIKFLDRNLYGQNYGANASLLRICANQTVILRGPKLEGKSNKRPLVSLSGTGSEFRLVDGVIAENYNSNYRVNDPYGSGVYIADGGVFTMSGGSISGNKVSSSDRVASGAGVYIADGGVFTMSGGTISGNKAQGSRSAYGAGVYIADGGVFTMSSGAISGNEVSPSIYDTGLGMNYAYGGGVGAEESGSPIVQISGNAVICNNKAVNTGRGTASGGGTYGRIQVSGNAVIRDNEVITEKGSARGGGVDTGIQPKQGSIISGSAVISGNKATSTAGAAAGGGVYGRISQISENAVIKDNEVSGSTQALGGGVRTYNQSLTVGDNVVISGNKAVSTSGAAFGGGVYFLFRETSPAMTTSWDFVKSGNSVIYGNNAEEGLRNTAQNSIGHAVYIGGNLRRDTTSGPGEDMKLVFYRGTNAEKDRTGWEE